MPTMPRSSGRLASCGDEHRKSFEGNGVGCFSGLIENSIEQGRMTPRYHCNKGRNWLAKKELFGHSMVSVSPSTCVIAPQPSMHIDGNHRTLPNSDP